MQVRFGSLRLRPGVEVAGKGASATTVDCAAGVVAVRAHGESEPGIARVPLSPGLNFRTLSCAAGTWLVADAAEFPAEAPSRSCSLAEAELGPPCGCICRVVAEALWLWAAAAEELVASAEERLSVAVAATEAAEAAECRDSALCRP